MAGLVGRQRTPGPRDVTELAVALDPADQVILDHVLSNTELSADGCWLWSLYTTHRGYGQVRVRNEGLVVHRLVWTLIHGPIAPGLVVDHTCHNGSGCAGGPRCLHRRCANPAHLEPVTNADNLRRAGVFNGDKTHCKFGHPFSPENTYFHPSGRRRCRMCRTSQGHARWIALRADAER